MARWQQLYEMLLNEDLSPQEIVSRLNVRPSRLRQLLAGKRLAARLQVAESVANRQAGHAVVSAVASAVRQLTALTSSNKDETARKSCLDVINTGRQVYKKEVNSQKEVSVRPPWASRPGNHEEPYEDDPGEDLPAAAAAAANPDDSAGHGDPAAAPAETPADRSKQPARRTGSSLESVLAEARRRREFRQEIVRHGGERIARRIQLGR